MKMGLSAIASASLLWMSVAGASAAVHEFQLRDTEGSVHIPAEWRAHKLIVLFFVTNDCPLTNSYVPEMNRIQSSYAKRRVCFYAVQADPNSLSAVMAAYSKQYHYNFPLLLDPSQILVRLTGATITPEAVVLSSEGSVLYRGRIDNRVEDIGRQKAEATIHDLRDALDALLDRKPVPIPYSKSIGCAIPEKK